MLRRTLFFSAKALFTPKLADTLPIAEVDTDVHAPAIMENRHWRNVPKRCVSPANLSPAAQAVKEKWPNAIFPIAPNEWKPVMHLFARTTHGTPADVFGLPADPTALQDAVTNLVNAASTQQRAFHWVCVSLNAEGVATYSLEVFTDPTMKPPSNSFLVVPSSSVMHFDDVKEAISWSSAVWCARCVIQSQLGKDLPQDDDILRAQLHSVVHIGREYTGSAAEVVALDHHVRLIRQVEEAAKGSAKSSGGSLDRTPEESVVHRRFLHTVESAEGNPADAWPMIHHKRQAALRQLLVEATAKDSSPLVPTLVGLRGIGKSHCIEGVAEALRCTTLLRSPTSSQNPFNVVVHLNMKEFLKHPEWTLSHALLHGIMCSPIPTASVGCDAVSEFMELLNICFHADLGKYPPPEPVEMEQLEVETTAPVSILDTTQLEVDASGTNASFHELTRSVIERLRGQLRSVEQLLTKVEPTTEVVESLVMTREAAVSLFLSTSARLSEQSEPIVKELHHRLKAYLDEDAKIRVEAFNVLKAFAAQMFGQQNEDIEELRHKMRILEVAREPVQTRFKMVLDKMATMLGEHGRLVFLLDEVDQLQVHPGSIVPFPSSIEFVFAILKVLRNEEASSSNMRLMACGTTAYCRKFDEMLDGHFGDETMRNLKPISFPRPGVDEAVLLLNEKFPELHQNPTDQQLEAAASQALLLMNIKDITANFPALTEEVLDAEVAEMAGQMRYKHARTQEASVSFPPPLTTLLEMQHAFPRQHRNIVDIRLMSLTEDEEGSTLKVDFPDGVEEAIFRLALNSERHAFNQRLLSPSLRYDMLFMKCHMCIFLHYKTALHQVAFAGCVAPFTYQRHLFAFSESKICTLVNVPRFKRAHIKQYISVCHNDRGKQIVNATALQCLVGACCHSGCEEALHVVDTAVELNASSTLNHVVLTLGYVTPHSNPLVLMCKGGSSSTVLPPCSYTQPRQGKDCQAINRSLTRAKREVLPNSLHHRLQLWDLSPTTQPTHDSTISLYHNDVFLGQLSRKDGAALLTTNATCCIATLKRKIRANDLVDTFLELLALKGVAAVEYVCCNDGEETHGWLQHLPCRIATVRTVHCVATESELERYCAA